MKKIIKAAVDRYEGNCFVCIGDIDGQEYLISKSSAALAEGDLVTLTYDGETLLSVIPDKEATEQRRADNSRRLQSLFNRKKS